MDPIRPLAPLLAAAAAGLLPGSLPAQGFPPLSEQRFRIEGVEAAADLGWSVAGLGDTDGDGVPDPAYGAPLADPSGLASAGSVWIVSGLDGAERLRIDGAAAGDRFGWSLAAVGDVDGDGVDDLLVGAPQADPGGLAEAGAAEVRSGADGSLILALAGPEAGDLFGWSVAGPGDVDGDGVPDLLVGARGASPGGVVSAGSVLLHSGADGSLLQRFDGATPGAWLGVAVAAAGDVDGDGTPDLLLGSPQAGPGGAGAGRAEVRSGADGSLLLALSGLVAGDRFGSAVASPGDLDGDGVPDLLVGAPGADPAGRLEAGTAEVFSGATGTPLLSFAGSAVGDELGRAVAPLGDADGDGTPDLLVGSGLVDPNSIGNAGAALVFSGADGALLHRFLGASGDRLGDAVAGAGDLNGDGLADVLAGAWNAAVAGGTRAGAVEAWLSLADTDGDLLADLHELAAGTDPADQDSDDDGLSDWHESSLNPASTGTDPLLLDSDGDGLQDGTELGRRNGMPGDPGLGVLGTDPAVFQPDLDPATTTDPLAADTDGGGIGDGGEDANLDGRRNAGESDPNDPLDDRVPGRLILSTNSLSASAGGTVTMQIDFHAGMAGHDFRVLGSFTGTDPPIVYGGVTIPLVYDALTRKLARQDYEPSMQNFSGVLDSNGDGLALIVALPGELTPWIGRSFWWSVLSMEGTIPSNATEAAILTITP